MTKNYYIYSLNCPITNKIKYIGYTDHIKRRLRVHIGESRSKRGNSYKCKWIKSLLNKNLRPIINILMTTTEDKVKFIEIEMIKHYKQFCKLTNLTNGGDGILGFKHSEKSKLQMSIDRKGIFNGILKEVILEKNEKILNFKNAKEASLYLNCTTESLTQCARGRRKTIKTYKCYYKKGAE